METKRNGKFTLEAEAKKGLIHDLNVFHRPKNTRRNVLLGILLGALFCTLLFARLSALQAYCVSIAFLSLAGYTIVVRFRE